MGQLIVQKYGGSSVADRREDQERRPPRGRGRAPGPPHGRRGLGDGQDHRRPHRPRRRRSPRRRIRARWTCCSPPASRSPSRSWPWRSRRSGHPARSLHRAAGRHRHRRRAHAAPASSSITAERDRRRARRGQGRGRRGLPGRDRGRRHHHARPRRLRPHRGGAGRRAQGRRVRDLHRRGRRLHRRPQRRARRAQARPDLLRRDARDGQPRGQGAPGPLGRVRQEVRRARSTCAPPSSRTRARS